MTLRLIFHFYIKMSQKTESTYQLNGGKEAGNM